MDEKESVERLFAGFDYEDRAIHFGSFWNGSVNVQMESVYQMLFFCSHAWQWMLLPNVAVKRRLQYLKQFHNKVILRYFKSNYDDIVIVDDGRSYVDGVRRPSHFGHIFSLFIVSFVLCGWICSVFFFNFLSNDLNRIENMFFGWVLNAREKKHYYNSGCVWSHRFIDISNSKNLSDSNT